jgi:hypothetical protein
MKFFLPLIFISCLQMPDASAQKRVKNTINPGEKFVDKLPREEGYMYPEFVKGKVYLKNNTVSLVQLNYNSLYAEMQFINPKGDTLSVADEKQIKLIVINQDTFFYDKSYLKLVSDLGKVKLANNQFFEIVKKEKIGEFGQPGRGSVETYNNISSPSYIRDIVANEIITMAKSSVYYIGDEFNNFKVANKKNLLEIYSKHEGDVKSYLKENKVDFSNEKDLKKMLAYLKKLEPVQPL